MYHPLHHHPGQLVLNGLSFANLLFQVIAQGKQFIDFGNNAIPTM
jgi:hypothetical protein